MDNEFQEFPKWKYHDANPPTLVNSADEEAALGDGWRDTPDAPPKTRAKK